MFRRSEAVETSYEALVTVLTTKNRLVLIARVNRTFNIEICNLTKAIADIFKSLEKIDEPTLSLIGPSYYLLMWKFAPAVRDSVPMQTFKKNLRKYMDEKFWKSIESFLDPSFKKFDFIPQNSTEEKEFKCNLMADLDVRMLIELDLVANKMRQRSSATATESTVTDTAGC